MSVDIAVETEDHLAKLIVDTETIDQEKEIVISRMQGRFAITTINGKTLLSSIPITKSCTFGHKFELIAASTSQILCWAEGEIFPGRIIELKEYIYDLTFGDATLTVMSTTHFWKYNARMELTKKVNHQLGPSKIVADSCNVIWIGDKAGRVYRLRGSKPELVDTIPASIQQATFKGSTVLFKTIQGWHNIRDQVQD